MYKTTPFCKRVMVKKLTDDDIVFFEKNGYIHIRDCVPLDQVSAALSIIDDAYDAGNTGTCRRNPKDVRPTFGDEISKHPAVLAPMGKNSGADLYGMVEQLLGEGNILPIELAQVAYREPSDYWKNEGWTLHTELDDDSWHIDGGPGLYATNGTPFTLIVGICLSEDQESDLNLGQFVLWPKSHHVLHKGVEHRAVNNLITDPYSIFQGTRETRPYIGKPKRMLMKPGDAVIAHQRTGHTGGPNLGATVRKNIYIRVSHRNHDELLKNGTLIHGSVWSEFEGLRDTMEKLRGTANQPP